MNNLNRNLSVLIRMKNYCNKIEETLNRFNKDYKIFLEDEDFKDSISIRYFK